MTLRNKIITIIIILSGIISLIYMYFDSIETKNIIDNPMKNIADFSIDSKDTLSVSYKDDVRVLEIIKNEDIIINNNDLDLPNETNVNNLLDTEIIKTDNILDHEEGIENYSFNLRSELLEFNFSEPITIRSDNSISFGPMGIMPESPTDRKIMVHDFHLNLVYKSTGPEILQRFEGHEYIKPKLLNIGGFDIYYWSEGGMCAGRVFEIIGIFNNIEISNQGCNSKTDEEVLEYISTIVTHINKSDNYDDLYKYSYEVIDDIKLTNYYEEKYNLVLDYPSQWKIYTKEDNFNGFERKVITFTSENISFGETNLVGLDNKNIKLELFIFTEKSLLDIPYGMFFGETGYRTILDTLGNEIYIKYYIHNLNTSPLSEESDNYNEYKKLYSKYNTEYNYKILKFIKSINIAKYKDLDIIYNYYNRIENKDYEGAYGLKISPGYNLEKFKNIYNNVTNISTKYISNSDNEYNLIITLYDNGIREKYEVVLIIENNKIFTKSTKKIIN